MPWKRTNSPDGLVTMAHPLFTALVAALAGGLIAIIAAYVGAKVSVDGARDSSVAVEKQRAADERLVAARSKRSSVYRAYLLAASEYNLDTATLRGDLHRITKLPASARAPERSVPRKLLTTWNRSRADYQHQVNDVYVFGSDSAWIAHRKVANFLPPAQGDTDTKVVQELIRTESASHKQGFSDAYDEFEDMFCREVGAPGRSCPG